MVKYRSKFSGATAEYDGRNELLERSQRWERVENEPTPTPVAAPEPSPVKRGPGRPKRNVSKNTPEPDGRDSQEADDS